ncbi:MAG: FG-GAP-like repeat-containing protein [Verrucomicrobiia bacterium]
MTTKAFLLAGLCIVGALGSQAQGPSITRQPADQSVSLGATVRFTVVATSTAPPITYQWRFNDVPLNPELNPSAATSRLSLTNVTLASAGTYAVVVSDTSGSVVSPSATLSIDPTFTKITTGAWVTELGESTGATSGDFDADGYPDLFVSRYRIGLSTLYHNNRDGTFIASTSLPSQTTADVWWAPAVAADFNNDGKLDLFAPREGKAGFFYFGNGDGTFISSQFLSATSWNVAIADYDRDGWLDVYLSSDGRLFRNNGDGTFTKTASLGGGGAWGGRPGPTTTTTAG